MSASASIFFVKLIRSLLIQRTPAGSSFRLLAETFYSPNNACLAGYFAHHKFGNYRNLNKHKQHQGWASRLLMQDTGYSKRSHHHGKKNKNKKKQRKLERFRVALA